MADTKISALTSVSSLVDAAEFAVNDVGTSRKAAASQIKTYIGLKMVALSADLANATTTFAKVTGLDTTVGAGTWVFQYFIRYQSDTTTTGIKFAVNHTGTTTSFVAHSRHQAAAPDQTVITTGAVQGGAARAVSASVALIQTPSVDTINSDMFMVLEGLMVVTVSGNIELYHASEVATTTTIKQNSVLVLFQAA